MNSFFTAEFFAGNRQRLQLQAATYPIVITANGLLQRGGDSSYQFSQDANFWYLTGIDEPDVVLVIEEKREYLLVPARDSTRAAFDGQVNDDALANRSGIGLIFEAEKGWKELAKLLKRTGQVATVQPAPRYIDRYGLYANPAREHLLERIRSVSPEIKVVDLAPDLARMRMIKQPPELQAIQAAIDITLATIKEATTPAKLAQYDYEYELEAEISRGFRRRGSSGHSFDPIVAGGKQACTLHNVANNAALRSLDLVTVDVGAEVEHYAADITRTLSLGKATRRQRAVHDAVYEVQQFALGLLKPGVLLTDYEHEIELFMGEKLRTLGLIGSINHDSVRQYYPHATSHFLGLNVHDAGDYGSPLAAGTVITVEPGIYIPEESIGVRIEDDILITDTGIEVLSKRSSGQLAP